MLEDLDTFVEQVDAARYATLAYADVAPDTGLVRFAVAGHLPPVMIDPGVEPRLVMEGRSPPLGVTSPRIERSQCAFTLGPGAGLLLYTDGLVERRTERGASDDDVCLLGFRLSAVGPVPAAGPDGWAGDYED